MRGIENQKRKECRELKTKGRNLNREYNMSTKRTGVITPICEPMNSAKLTGDILNPSAICACPAVCLKVTQSLPAFQTITGLKTIRLKIRLIYGHLVKRRFLCCFEVSRKRNAQI